MLNYLRIDKYKKGVAASATMASATMIAQYKKIRRFGAEAGIVFSFVIIAGLTHYLFNQQDVILK